MVVVRSPMDVGKTAEWVQRGREWLADWARGGVSEVSPGTNNLQWMVFTSKLPQMLPFST